MYGEHSIRAAYNPYVERAHRERSQAVAKVWNGAVVGGARLSGRPQRASAYIGSLRTFAAGVNGDGPFAPFPPSATAPSRISE